MSCSFRSSICLTSSRFSEDKVHQLQMSIRHAKRSPPTRRGGHLPPPTLIPSIPITLSFASGASYTRRNICHVIDTLQDSVCMQRIYVSRAFSVKHDPRSHITSLTVRESDSRQTHKNDVVRTMTVLADNVRFVCLKKIFARQPFESKIL